MLTGSVSLPLAQFKSSYVTRVDSFALTAFDVPATAEREGTATVMPASALASSTTPPPAATAGKRPVFFAMMRLSLGLHRTRAPVDVETLPDPLLFRQGAVCLGRASERR